MLFSRFYCEVVDFDDCVCDFNTVVIILPLKVTTHIYKTCVSFKLEEEREKI